MEVGVCGVSELLWSGDWVERAGEVAEQVYISVEYLQGWNLNSGDI